MNELELVAKVETLEKEVENLKMYIQEISGMMMTLHDVHRGTFPPYEFDGCSLYWLMYNNENN